MKCKDCKYWDGTFDEKAKPFISWGQDISNMRECKNENITNMDKPMISTDYDGPQGNIQTHGNFGCIFFEPK